MNKSWMSSDTLLLLLPDNISDFTDWNAPNVVKSTQALIFIDITYMYLELLIDLHVSGFKATLPMIPQSRALNHVMHSKLCLSPLIRQTQFLTLSSSNHLWLKIHHVKSNIHVYRQGLQYITTKAGLKGFSLILYREPNIIIKFKLDMIWQKTGYEKVADVRW